MRITFKQIVTSFLALVATWGLLWLGQQIYQRDVVRTPLGQAVARIPGVARAVVTGSGSDEAVGIWLKPGAALSSVYPAVQDTVTRMAGRALPVTIHDDRTPAEAALYNRLRFVVAQGEATGQYVAMVDQVDRLAAQAGDRAELVLGDNAMYLTLTDARQHRLLAVLPLNWGDRRV
ncbi:MAG: hypothetical protein K6V97_08290 [Actinomycetia bacterium]|nr:hypothetical protein [Actinomycetes bacterium]